LTAPYNLITFDSSLPCKTDLAHFNRFILLLKCGVCSNVIITLRLLLNVCIVNFTSGLNLICTTNYLGDTFKVSLLELKNVTKSFGAIHALQGVNLSLQAGEAVGLMGDNGAGKSTLMKIIAGNFPPTTGEIIIDEQPVKFTKPLDARKSGIEIVYQDLALCDNLTASANVFLGRELKKKVGPFSMLDYPAMYEKAAQLFSELKSETRPRDLVKQMSGGQRQAVAIARTRLSDPKLVLMDEPTAAISVRQVAEVLALITRLKETGHAVILVSHRMPDVFDVCDRVAVLRRGVKVADKRISDTSPEEVTGLIIGAIEAA